MFKAIFRSDPSSTCQVTDSPQPARIHCSKRWRSSLACCDTVWTRARNRSVLIAVSASPPGHSKAPAASPHGWLQRRGHRPPDQENDAILRFQRQNFGVPESGACDTHPQVGVSCLHSSRELVTVARVPQLCMGSELLAGKRAAVHDQTGLLFFHMQGLRDCGRRH